MNEIAVTGAVITPCVNCREQFIIVNGSVGNRVTLGFDIQGRNTITPHADWCGVLS